MEPLDFTWIFGLGVVASMADAFGIGANDVANSFATSVSSGSLTLAQACIIATFTEFLGAVLLGESTADTIKSGVIDVNMFVPQPELLMLGMLCAVFGSAVWVLAACRAGVPVSTSHSIVGALIGVGIAAFGADGVQWTFGGVGKIILSWFASPLAAGIVTAIIYMPTKYLVLRHENSFQRGLRAIPVYFFITGVIGAFYLIYKGAPGTDSKNLSAGVAVGIAFGIGTALALFSYFFFGKWLDRRINGREDLRWYHLFVIYFVKHRPLPTDEEQAAAACNAAISEKADVSIMKDEIHESSSRLAPMTGTDDDISPTHSTLLPQSDHPDTTVAESHPPKTIKDRFRLAGQWTWRHVRAALLHGVVKDVRNLDNPKLRNVHQAAAKFDDNTEYLFSFLQVVTAMLMSFAHGSNDVANAAGPLASIYGIWQAGAVDTSGEVAVPKWILAAAGGSIVLGLLLYGYRVMRKMGNNITYLTPSRGFSAELASALTVLTCSKIGIPVSTTQVATGAIAAVGLCNGSIRAVNWKMLGWCFLSWVLTLPIAGLMAGLVFGFGAHAPDQTI